MEAASANYGLVLMATGIVTIGGTVAGEKVSHGRP